MAARPWGQSIPARGSRTRARTTVRVRGLVNRCGHVLVPSRPGPIRSAAVLALAAPAVMVGERGCAERGSPQRPQQLRGERRPVLRAQYSLTEDRAEPAGERQPHEHQAGCGYQDGYKRGGDDSERNGDTPATQEWYSTREDLAPALNEPQRKYVHMLCPHDRLYCNHFTYVFGSDCSGIGIQEVRLFIRGSAIVPTTSFFLSRAPKRCLPCIYGHRGSFIHRSA